MIISIIIFKTLVMAQCVAWARSVLEKLWTSVPIRTLGGNSNSNSNSSSSSRFQGLSHWPTAKVSTGRITQLLQPKGLDSDKGDLWMGLKELNANQYVFVDRDMYMYVFQLKKGSKEGFVHGWLAILLFLVLQFTTC